MPYRTVAKEEIRRCVVRHSVFIARVREVADEAAVRRFLAEVKAAEPAADHHCYAYRLGDQGQFAHSSDGGEPAGTAGRPILGALVAAGVTNAMVVVTRYFGGRKLGIPGLAEAYRSAA
ncbi:MAG: IMPACT family protein, partial [Bacteroidota bacterium]